MKFACFAAAVLSVIVSRETVQGIELMSHHHHDMEDDLSQTWFDDQPVDLTETFNEADI